MDNHIGKVPLGQPLDESVLAGSANVSRFAHNVLIVDHSARGGEFRYIKFTKQRKGAMPDEVIEVHISGVILGLFFAITPHSTPPN